MLREGRCMHAHRDVGKVECRMSAVNRKSRRQMCASEGRTRGRRRGLGRVCMGTDVRHESMRVSFVMRHGSEKAIGCHSAIVNLDSEGDLDLEVLCHMPLKHLKP